MSAELKTKTLNTVSDYITDVRTLLIDTIQPYRYDDTSLLVALNVALLEGRRLRPDIFISKHEHRDEIPSYTLVDGAEVHIEPQFRLAFVYGTLFHALSRDQESVEDARANSFYALFEYLLTGKRAAPPVSGATPNQKSITPGAA